MEEERRLKLNAPAMTIATVWPLWFFAVYALAAAGLFARPDREPPLPILLGVTVPLGIFIIALAAGPSFRRTVLSLDPRVLTAMQAWRAAGLGFLALYSHKILPGLFAWPAGLGDLAIGLSAPWVVAALLRDPAFVGSRTYLLWNIFGILDLIVAVGLGTLSSWFAVGGVTTAPMSRLPLVLIPAFFVPLFLMLHVVALLQHRRTRQPEEASSLGARS